MFDFDSEECETEPEDEYAVQQVAKANPQNRRPQNFPRNRDRALLLEIVNIIKRGGLNVSNEKQNSSTSPNFGQKKVTQNSETQTNNRCYICGDSDHFARECPKNPRNDTLNK